MPGPTAHQQSQILRAMQILTKVMTDTEEYSYSIGEWQDEGDGRWSAMGSVVVTASEPNCDPDTLMWADGEVTVWDISGGTEPLHKFWVA